MRKIIILILLMTISSLASAQDFYLGANVSRSISLSENMRLGGVIGTPGINFSVGSNLNRKFGLRATAGLNPQDGYGKHLSRPGSLRYSFMTATGYIDGMFNLLEIFSKSKDEQDWTLDLIVGGGVLAAGNFSTMIHEPKWVSYEDVCTTRKFYGVGHFGISAAYMLSPLFDLYMETKLNILSDKYNGIQRGTKADCFLDVNIGVNWYLSRKSHRHEKKSDIPREVLEALQNEHLVPGRRMKNAISFYFDFSDVAVSQAEYVKVVAKFMKANPAAKIIIHGYADREATNAESLEHNKELAEARAQSVLDCLVNEYKISPSRLSVSVHENALSGFKQESEWVRAVEFEMAK